MLVPVVTEAESWISDATWAPASMARSRVRGEKKNITCSEGTMQVTKGGERGGCEAVSRRRLLGRLRE